jgi:hypothetical protein
MPAPPLKIDQDTRVYVRVALRDTIEAYDLADLLDLMADICQQNADSGRAGGKTGLIADAWQLRADVLRDAAERLDPLMPEADAPGRPKD